MVTPQPQLVKADGLAPGVQFCLRFLPVREEFFPAAVTKCLLMGKCWVSLNEYLKEYHPDLLYVKSALR